MRRQKVTVLLVVANLCLLTVYVGGWTSGRTPAPRSQEEGKSVVKHFAPRHEPIEVTGLKIKGRAVKLGEVVKDEPDWLRHLVLEVKNRSDKPIALLQIDLDFPETRATGSVMMHQLFIGWDPDFRSTSGNQPLGLKPGESVHIPLGPEYAGIKRLIELRQPSVENINHVVVRLGEVRFEDGTRYSGGRVFKRGGDENGRPKWIPATGAGAAYQNN